MYLIHFCSAALLFAVAVRSDFGEENRILDLQKMLQDVQKSYKEYSLSFKKMSVDFSQTVKDINIKMLRITENVNENSRRAKEESERTQLLVKENREVLSQILLEIEKIQKSTRATTTPAPIQDCKNNSVTTTTIFPLTPSSQDCATLRKAGNMKNGAYMISPGGLDSFPVFCDMTTDGGGWTVFQRRGDYGFPKDYFYKTWEEYKKGFGELTKEFWLGNDRLSALTLKKRSHLRVDLRGLDGEQAFAKYCTFRVENELKSYKLVVGKYSGTAGDSLASHSLYPFSTKDRENPSNNKKCSQNYKGGWWYHNDCYQANLNGLNMRVRTNAQEGIVWYGWKRWDQSLGGAEMKLRPADFGEVILELDKDYTF